MALKKNKISLTSGPPLKGILFLSFPIMISNLMHVVYNIADTAWLGLLGKEEVAAMAFAFPILFLVISVGMGVGIAGSVLVAQHEGAGDKKAVNHAAGQTLVFAFILSVLISVSGYFSAGTLVNFLGASPEVSILAESYLKVMFGGVVLIFSFFIFNSLMRACGNSKTPMKVMIWSNLLNIVLDPFFIFGIWIFPELGIAGAALATVISRFLASLVGLRLLFHGSYGLSLRGRDLIPEKKTLIKLCRLGWPAVTEQATKGLGMMAITTIAAAFGTAFMAGYSVGLRVFSVFIMPSLALGVGASASVGQNLGAGLQKRASAAAALSAVTVLGFLSVLAIGIYIFRFNIASFFLGSSEPEAAAYAGRFIIRLALAAPFLGAAITFRGAFKGAGRTLQSMLIAITGIWVLRAGFAFLAARVLSSRSGLWNAFIVGGVGEFLICLFYFFKGNWPQVVIKKPPPVPSEDISSDLT